MSRFFWKTSFDKGTSLLYGDLFFLNMVFAWHYYWQL